MEALVKRLDCWLKANRPSYYAILYPGAKAKEIREFENWIGFSLPQSWKDLYQWRNGQHDPNSLDANGQVDTTPWQAFQHNQVFDSLHVIKRQYQLMKDLLEGGEFDKKNWWNPKWVPFLTSLGGDMLCIDMEGTFRGTPGQLIYFYHDDATRIVRFPGVEAWLETFVGSLESGMWEEEDGCFQPKDPDEWMSLCEKMNRGYPKYEQAR